ncbi:MAG: hypothetical protein JSS25_08155 [Proteobacteria bacterium]|nr:hypothetical protein [Pseudomonadota bacterium]
MRRFLLVNLLVGVLSALPFLPGLPGEFTFDDIPNIVNNESIQLTRLDASSLMQVIATPQVSGAMRGLPTLTFALDYWRGHGADPGTFKTTNIFIHVITTCVLAWFFLRLLLLTRVKREHAQWIAPALALAWAIHPLQVSSVLYPVQRLQTMGTLFLVLALIAYLRAREMQIRGLSGRKGILVAVLLWALALGCKEDSILLPVYTLALEFTVLRFKARDPVFARRLRLGYLTALGIGLAGFFLVVVPMFWNWAPYPGRGFSTPERLLTEARVLCMYLWQIAVPMPSHMPFYYDWLEPSRGFLHPWTTLASIVLLLSLLFSALRLRASQPLYTLGVLLFFSAHFISSNVIGLELAFEHRNHFALIGAILAIGSLLANACRGLHVREHTQLALCAALLVGLFTATGIRAHEWSSLISMARVTTQSAPTSARGWIQLCTSQFRQGGGPKTGNTHLNDAISSCEQGARLAPYALNNVALLIVLKTLRGDVSTQDWQLLRQRLATVNMTWDNQRAPSILTYHWLQGVKLDKRELLETLDIFRGRSKLNPGDYASLGYFIMSDLNEPDRSFPYFAKSIESTPTDAPFPQDIESKFESLGRHDLAVKIRQLEAIRQAQGKSGDGKNPNMVETRP